MSLSHIDKQIFQYLTFQGGLHILVGHSVGHRTSLEYATHSETTHLKYGPHYLVEKVTF